MADRFHQLILFWDVNFGGDHKHVFRSLSLGGDPWNDQTSSFAITGGAWKLFKNFDYEPADGSVFAPRAGGYSWVEDYDIPNDSLSSVALVDDDSSTIPHLILFSGANFSGDHRHVFSDLASGGSWKSLVIFAGLWHLTNEHGVGVDVPPGPYQDIAVTGFSGKLSTISLKDPSYGLASGPEHIIVFENSNFSGRHRHIFTELDHLDGRWDRLISSIVVEKGAWQIYRDVDYQNPQGPVLTRGIYPWVDDIEIDNDAAASLQPASRPSGSTLVTVSKINNGTNVLTAHGDNYRLGWNSHETQLTPENVRIPYFGRLWARRMQGVVLGVNLSAWDGNAARVYGQPLYVSNVRVGGPSGPVRDLVIVATAKNDVVALDAVSGDFVWVTHLDTPVDDAHFNRELTGSCKNTSPWHGVDSTPVIGPSGTTVYVAYLTLKLPSPGHPEQIYYLQALRVNDGSLVWSEPVELTGSYGAATFKPFVHTQRAGLTYLQDGFGQTGHDYVLVPFSSRCDLLSKDNDDWQGWVFAVDVTSDPPPSPIVFSSSQAAKGLNGCGGIWGTAGLAVDDQGRIYAVTGNGPWDGKGNFPDSVLRLGPTDLTIHDYYTPKDWPWLKGNDADLGSCSAVLLPPQPLGLGSSTGREVFANVVVTAGKDGRVYFLDGDQLGNLGDLLGHLGHAMWRPRVFSYKNDPVQGGIATTPVFFDAGPAGRFLYVASAASGDDTSHVGLIGVKLDDLNGETMLGSRVIQFEGERLHGAPGTPWVSSNGSDNGIVWLVDSFRGRDDDGPQSILRAWDAVTGRLLYSSPQTPSEVLGDGRKFVGLTVIKGRVYVPADGVVCYGLKVGSAVFHKPPIGLE